MPLRRSGWVTRVGDLFTFMDLVRFQGHQSTVRTCGVMFARTRLRYLSRSGDVRANQGSRMRLQCPKPSCPISVFHVRGTTRTWRQFLSSQPIAWIILLVITDHFSVSIVASNWQSSPSLPEGCSLAVACNDCSIPPRTEASSDLC